MRSRKGIPALRWMLFGCVVLAASFSCSDSPTTQHVPTFEEELQEALDSSLASCDGYGATAAVLAPGRDIWLGTGGISHGTVPVVPEMIFGIASITKAFVATVVFMLAEDGLLTLEDSLHQWLPAYQYVDSTITIRQLLGHTSGLYGYDGSPDFWEAMASDLARVWSPEELLLTFLREPYFPPGSGFRYSITNYILLGMIIEEATGAEVSTALRSRILDPLGMEHTFLMIDEDVIGEMVHPWWDMDEDGVPEDMTAYPREAFYSMGWTAGAMVSTAEELVRFSRALFEGDLVGPASLNQMLDFHPVGRYGLGLHLWDFLPGTTAVGHRGGDPLTQSTMVYLPDHGVHFAVIINWRDDACNTAISRALARVAIE